MVMQLVELLPLCGISFFELLTSNQIEKFVDSTTDGMRSVPRVLFTHSSRYIFLHLFSAYEHFFCCIPDDDAEKALVKSEARRGGALAGQSHKTSCCST